MKIKNFEDLKLEAPISPEFHQAPPNNTTTLNKEGNAKTLAIDLEKITRSKSKNKENATKGASTMKASKYNVFEKIPHVRNDSKNSRNPTIDQLFTLEK